MNHSNRLRGIVLVLALLLLAACNDASAPAVSDAPISAETSSATATALPPTSTPLPTPTPTATPRPLAATVNGEPIYLADYDVEVAIQTVQFRGEDPRKLALDKLIEDKLIAQDAAQRGIQVQPQEVEAALGATVTQIGQEAYQLWLTENGYNETTFHDAVAAEMLRTRVLEAVTSVIGDSAEFVRARIIQTDNPEDATEVVFQLQNGGEFVTLIDLYSTEIDKQYTRGDIGWFTRGMLTVPELEPVAFGLQPGEFSDVIAVTGAPGQTVYYIVMVTDRDPARPYTAAQKQRLVNELALEWLANARNTAAIDVLVGLD
jgi:parvulin-like peptidyl-prolyl isomerase